MSLFAIYHFGHYVGTWLVIKAENAEQADKEARQLLCTSYYSQPALRGQKYLFQIACSDEREEQLRQFYRMLNVEIIKNAFV